MRDLRILKDLQNIRLHRVEAAQKAVQVALKNVVLAKEALKKAESILEEYSAQLPSLIDALYLKCMNKAVGQSVVEEVRANELKLLSKKEEYRGECQNAQDELAKCEQNVIQAKNTLKKEQLKYDGFGELVKEEVRKNTIEIERQENKKMDEFSSNKYITNSMVLN